MGYGIAAAAKVIGQLRDIIKEAIKETIKHTLEDKLGEGAQRKCERRTSPCDAPAP